MFDNPKTNTCFHREIMFFAFQALPSIIKSRVCYFNVLRTKRNYHSENVIFLVYVICYNILHRSGNIQINILIIWLNMSNASYKECMKANTKAFVYFLLFLLDDHLKTQKKVDLKVQKAYPVKCLISFQYFLHQLVAA